MMSPLLRFPRRVGRGELALLVLGTLATVLVTVWRVDPDSGVLWAALLVSVAAPILIWVDLLERRLPDVITLPLVPLVIGALAVPAVAGGEWARFGMALLAGAGVGLFFFTLFLISPTSIGFGDVKLALSLGPAIGWFGPLVTVVGVFGMLVLGLVHGLVVMVLTRQGRSTSFPFGPAMLCAALLCLWAFGGA